MKPFVFNLLARLSLVLCVLMGGLWLRQRYQADQWTWYGGTGPAAAASFSGSETTWVAFSGKNGIRLSLMKFGYDYPQGPDEGGDVWLIGTRADRHGCRWIVSPARDWQWWMAATPYWLGTTDTTHIPHVLTDLGFDLTFSSFGDKSIHGTGLTLGGPTWFALTLFAVLPLILEIRQRRRPRKPGLPAKQ